MDKILSLLDVASGWSAALAKLEKAGHPGQQVEALKPGEDVGGAHAAVKKAALVQPDSNSVEFVQANELRKGNYILINGRVCRVGDYSTSKTGKHGQ